MAIVVEKGEANRQAAGDTASLAFVSLSLCALLAALGTSAANVALPVLEQAFNASFREVQWIVLAYLLTLTTVVVIGGRLGDMFGRRRVLLIGLALFSLASAACAAAPTLPFLLVGRGLQGIGAAFMMSLTLALVGETIRKDRVGSAMGLLATMSASGTALGPFLGGLLITRFDWPAIFLINVPAGLLAFGLTWRSLPRDGGKTAPRRFDFAGALVLAAVLIAYTLAMTAAWDRSDWLHAVLVAAVVLGLWMFIKLQRKSASPLLDFATLASSGLCKGLAMSALVSTVMMSTLVVGPFYLAGGLGLDASRVGFVLAIGPLTVALAGIPAGRLTDRFGAPPIVQAGLAAMTAGCALLALLPAAAGVAGYIACIVLITAGYALFLTANNAAALGELAADRRGVASGLLNLARNLGLITGASAMAAIFACFAAGREAAIAAEGASLGLRAVFTVATILTVLALAIAANVDGRVRQTLRTFFRRRGQ